MKIALIAVIAVFLIAVVTVAVIGATGGFDKEPIPTPTPTPMPTPSPTPTPTPMPTPTPTPTPTPISIPEPTFPSYFYSAITIGGFVHQIGFNLHNDSLETITIREINFYDQYDVLQHNIPESEIIDVWGTGEVEPYNYFSGFISFQIPESEQEIQQWEIRWHCTDAYQQDFTVIGIYHET